MNLRRLLLHRLGTKLAALAIAFVAWYALSGARRERISERSYRIPLSVVNIPSGTIIVSPLPDAVDVRLRGAFSALRALDASRLDAVVDLLDAEPGERRYALEPEDINVPGQLEVIAIAPSEVRVLLDRTADRTVPIVADITGRPADGFRVAEIVVEPRLARIVGPASTVAKANSVRTDPVSVEGRNGSLVTSVTVLPPGPGVRVREGQIVTLRVRIRPGPTPLPTVKPGKSRKR